MTSHTESLPGATPFRAILVVVTVLVWSTLVVLAGSMVVDVWRGDLSAARALAIGWSGMMLYTLWDMAKYIRTQVREMRA